MGISYGNPFLRPKPVALDQAIVMARWPAEMTEKHGGAHSLTHPDLTRLPSNQIEKEIQESKNVIEQQTGARVDSFAYPFRKHNAQCRSTARQYFLCACTDRVCLIHSKRDPHALQRLDAYCFSTRGLLNLLFSRFFLAYIRAFIIPRNLRRAIWRMPIPNQ